MHSAIAHCSMPEQSRVQQHVPIIFWQSSGDCSSAGSSDDPNCLKLTPLPCSSQARGRQEPVQQEHSHYDRGGGAAVRPPPANMGDSLDAFSVKTAFLPVDHSQIPDRIPSPALVSRSHAEVQTQQVSAQLRALHPSQICLATSHGKRGHALLLLAA